MEISNSWHLYNPTTYYEYGFHTSWSGDDALLKLYDPDDLRIKAYFLKPCKKTGSVTIIPQYFAGQYCPCKGDNYATRTKFSSPGMANT